MKVATATGETVAECRANAAFIVRACNSHGELLAASEAAAKILGDIVTDNESDHGETAVLDRLSAAIAEAKGC